MMVLVVLVMTMMMTMVKQPSMLMPSCATSQPIPPYVRCHGLFSLKDFPLIAVRVAFCLAVDALYAAFSEAASLHPEFGTP